MNKEGKNVMPPRLLDDYCKVASEQMSLCEREIRLCFCA